MKELKVGFRFVPFAPTFKASSAWNVKYIYAMNECSDILSWFEESPVLYNSFSGEHFGSGKHSKIAYPALITAALF